MENKKKRIVILVVLLLLLVSATLGYLLWKEYSHRDGFQDDLNAEIGIMPGMSEEEIQKRLNTVLADNMMNVTINPNPIFETGRSEGELCIENIKQNHYNYIVTITLDDTHEEVYRSGLIHPNHYVQKAKLDVALKKGTYKATALFQAYREDKKKAGASMVKMQIEVRK